MTTIWHNLKETGINTLSVFGLAWWIEIETQNPRCTYYFGPYLSSTEAKIEIKGYVEDLEAEGAQGIVVNVKRCKPDNLTIADDLGEIFDRKVTPAFSGQI
ncbi:MULTISPECIES: DUF1816 domain-containing protein [unclassified Anabaena]|uniref:DUF1816 domain-containing protein n=1 Tax=unclassified Anabaena TaxID=2619674 RepID=UPI00082F70FE|nr:MULTISPECIES: DUF1816 domain-containing protein [unclassified Anabaena]